MGDFTKAHVIASQISDGKSPRRVKAVKNIVAACQKLIEDNTTVTYASVAERIEALGLQGGPKAQSIYNTDDLKALINAFADEATPKEVARSAKASFSTDEEEIMDALPTPRLKSMFRDIVADRSKALTQMRLLDAFVTKIKQSGGAIHGSGGNAATKIEHHSDEETAIVRDFFEVLFDYGFDLEDGEIVKGGKPTNSRKFVALLQRKGLL
ncbi:gamma-mobile-trio protein GmtX [Thioclava sp. F28-4]|uniref:gamma-mobile-trio protein GmtX n=1 Tax=Thioclava sp. F28-4 TaxID=1915315 RepID=UPI000996230D|nr:gamma-mobile-trio protein GmtX [Thioclava sp. F28-4]